MGIFSLLIGSIIHCLHTQTRSALIASILTYYKSIFSMKIWEALWMRKKNLKR